MIFMMKSRLRASTKLLGKHFILDRRQSSPDQSVSIELYELYQLVQAVRPVEDALGC